MEYKEFDCYSNNLCNWLYKRGFKHIAQRPNLKKPWFDVYVFVDSPELRAAVDDYSKRNN